MISFASSLFCSVTPGAIPGDGVGCSEAGGVGVGVGVGVCDLEGESDVCASVR